MNGHLFIYICMCMYMYKYINYILLTIINRLQSFGKIQRNFKITFTCDRNIVDIISANCIGNVYLCVCIINSYTLTSINPILYRSIFAMVIIVIIVRNIYVEDIKHKWIKSILLNIVFFIHNDILLKQLGIISNPSLTFNTASLETKVDYTY